MPSQPAEFWPQLQLFNTMRSIRLQPTLILDGPTSTISFGFEVFDFETGDLQFIQASGSRPLPEGTEWIKDQLLQAVQLCWSSLEPF